MDATGKPRLGVSGSFSGAGYVLPAFCAVRLFAQRPPLEAVELQQNSSQVSELLPPHPIRSYLPAVALSRMASIARSRWASLSSSVRFRSARKSTVAARARST